MDIEVSFHSGNAVEYMKLTTHIHSGEVKKGGAILPLYSGC
jgi:hypothetical protein